ncbi:HAD family phosphatase [Bifidobacterium sp. ESL0775]|uniref:HAD family hydrolase n=1 Tax=Bifidobacterium sp. ESL0775 TaxID=2983230 RepID=UPI0023F6BC63|nr:HAD family phosphatase [Bifidobacterium sp. ESL0775]WEV69298.1 HAD family phosphatase [Bifidobacterium sp. ESL0775]
MNEGRTLRAVLWDMDGTLIDSEPYWHTVEVNLAREHGGYWSEDIGWTCSGKPVPKVAELMIEKGTKLPAQEVQRRLIEGVARMEAEHMPWIAGVEDVLRSLVSAGIPSVLVTASPRRMAENLVRQAPEGAFVGYVCGEDDLPKKPNPAPYIAAAEVVGVELPHDIAVANGMADSPFGQLNRQDDGDQADKNVSPDDEDIASAHARFYHEMARCVALEDSMTGIQSAVGSGATTIAQTGFIKTDTSAGPQFASINNYDGLTAEVLERYAEQRLSTMKS